MSETKTQAPTESTSTKKKEAACSTGCGCSSTTAAKGTIQNGKGSAPRNMGPRYLSNFDGIKWGGDPSLKPSAGQKAVKVYR
jgi:hypothetical protein